MQKKNWVLLSNLDYNIGSSRKGPLTYQGTMNVELGANVVNGPKLNNSNYVPWRLTQSNHGGVVEYHGQEYLFYHTSALSSWRQDEFNGEGTWTQRSVCIDELNYNNDGTIIPVQQTIEGVKKIKIKQPFSIQLNPKKAFEIKNLKAKKGTITSLKNISSISFKNIDLGSGYYYFGLNLLKTPTKGRIEVRKDSANGYLMGTILLNNDTNNLHNNFADTFLREANGIHDIVLVFINDSSEELTISEPHFFAGAPKKINL